MELVTVPLKLEVGLGDVHHITAMMAARHVLFLRVRILSHVFLLNVT
jgi:hypothetical protein